MTPLMATYKLLLADAKGRVLEHPSLLATLRSDANLVEAAGRPVALPDGARLVHLPGRLPVGVDPETGEYVLVETFEAAGKTFRPSAVGAVLPPGYTRTFLPGEVKADGPVLPQWAYTGAAWSARGPVVWAIRTDQRGHWNPNRYSTPKLKGLVKQHLARFPNNRVLEQLKTCALVYRCFTSQNIFYCRDEGALPVSTMCNARCVGCISEQEESGPPASHARIDHGPSAHDLADVASAHLTKATGRTMVSFGQGCEGEPLTRWKTIAESIALTRARTGRGSINLNTNASLTKGLGGVIDSGLDAVRVSLNCASKDLYEAYYQPKRYGFEDVEASIALARERGIYLALNLLVFPGVTDRRGEVDALKRLVKKHKIDQLQTRPLAIDPAQYVELARDRGAGGEAIGIGPMLAELTRAAPWLSIGNFARGLKERS
jgi:pyruvate-formate lyase-activating enzyme